MLVAVMGGAAFLVSGSPASTHSRPGQGGLQAAADAAPDPIRVFYHSRDYRALSPPNAPLAFPRAVASIVAEARDDNLEPQKFHLERLSHLVSAAGANPALAGEAEVAAAEALIGYITALREPRSDLQMAHTASAVAPQRVDPAALLNQLASASDLPTQVSRLTRMNPIYEGLRESRRSAPLDPSTERLVGINLERARALPYDDQGRYIVVDAAAQKLILFEGGRPRDSMRVIVGKRSMPTPMMTGMITYAVADPYWNVPIDLVRDTIAPAVLKNGVGVIAARRMVVLSDWSVQATQVDPSRVDWKAVAEGRYRLRVRQLPGADNMMGRIKFMFPNTLGIYLHDTPDRQLFHSSERTYSSGCVRLEDAERLARWMGLRDNGGSADRQVFPPAPVPVYITYFTIYPGEHGLERRPDVYRRDAASTLLQPAVS